MTQLTEDVKISTAITPTAGAAGTADINGTTLDMQGFDAVACLVRMGAITGSAVTSIKWQQGDASNLSDAADLEGTAMDIADDDDDETFVADLIRPTKRYVRIVCDRATQNAVVAGANYLQYRARSAPVTHGTGVTIEANVTPAEGTA